MIDGSWSKGNRVMRISGEHNGMKGGDEDIIVSWGPDAFNLEKYRGGHYNYDLELISNSQKTELKGGKEIKMGKYKFNVGDKVKRIGGYNNGMNVGDIGTITEIRNNGETLDLKEYGDGHALSRFELVEKAPSNNICKMATKKIYTVFILDKKIGKTTKDEKVTAANEQEAILKTFGVDAENSFIKITEVGEYEEDKPIKAVIEKVEKPKE